MPLTASTQFINLLRFGAYLVQARLTLYQNGNPTSYIVPVSTGSITVDRNAAHRRTGTITAEIVPSVPPEPLMPTGPNSLLAPFGNELFIETGIASVPPGQISGAVVSEWVPLGLFSIATTTVEDTVNDLAVTLTLYDRSWVISQRKFLQPYNFPATPSGNFVAEIQALLNQVWGAPLTYNITPTTATVPVASYNQGSDPWQAALDMASAVGYELFFGLHGDVVGYPIPDPAMQPITWNFTDDAVAIYGTGGIGIVGSTALYGSPYSIPADITMTMTRDGIYNDVRITGTGTANAPYSNTGTGQPVLAIAQDTNPTSPTYVDGPMGDVPQFVSTNLTTSSPQAQAMADNDLQAALASAWQIGLSYPPNPIFDIDDVVTITRPRMGLQNVKVVIDQITHAISYSDVSKLTGRVVTS